MTNEMKEHISLFIDRNTAVCSDYFGIKYIPQEVLSKIKDKSIAHNIVRIQSDDSVMYGFYCIAFIEYMIAGKIYYLLITIKRMTR